MNSVAEIVDYLKRKNERLKPCDIYEVKLIEEKYGIALPKVYKEFLLAMGKEAGNYMKGSTVFYKDILNIHGWTKELIFENDLPSLPSDAFPFWMHQGYQAAYFKVTEGENPPVYYFTEGKGYTDFILDTKSLIDFFLVELKNSFPEDDIVW